MDHINGCLMGLAVGAGSRGVDPALHLWDALRSVPGPVFPADSVAYAYQKCRSVDKPFKTASTMRSEASKYSASQASDTLRRVAPISVWGVLRGLTLGEIASAARQDAMLSHPSKQNIDANAVYCVAIAWLLRNSGDAEGAIRHAERFSVDSDVQTWLRAVPERRHSSTNHVRHAFTLAFHHLRMKSTYEDAIVDATRRDGDTYVNAAVVGAMVGALHGMSSIPVAMIDSVLSEI